ncbi:hypothetical protein [Caulobacter endophyticus]|uniref:hypothetical protein n=1 Tax=Caulobacter endophyticus TaxID=2172652 RepID=UPI003220551E
MGWNAFRTEVDEAKVMGSAQALRDTGLARLGYRYVNLDDGWWLKRRASDGRLEIRTALFPSAAPKDGGEASFKPFVDRLHAMGFKASIGGLKTLELVAVSEGKAAPPAVVWGDARLTR